MPGDVDEWVISLLVTAHDAVEAVSAEGLLKTTLLDHAEGPQPVVSTVVRLADLPPAVQRDWRLAIQREADD